MSCGAETTAQRLYDALKQDASFNFPDIDWDSDEFKLPPMEGELYDPVTKLTTDDLTTGLIDGDGTFDKLMSSVKSHLMDEFERGRITGKEFSESYIQSTVAALGTAVQFLLGKEQANWQAVLLQLQAREAAISAVNAKIILKTSVLQYEVVKLQAEMSVIDYANKKIQLAIADEEYCIRKQQGELNEIEKATRTYNLNTMLPKQAEQLTAEITNIGKQGTILDDEHSLNMLRSTGFGIDNDTKTYNLVNILPKNVELLSAQVLGTEADTQGKIFNVTHVIPKQLELVSEQVETARAQTLDTRTDGVTPVAGILGKQRGLYDQQITSYQRDSEVKAAKMFIDAWITQKTIDEGLLPPEGFENDNLDQILAKLISNNGFGTMITD